MFATDAYLSRAGRPVSWAAGSLVLATLVAGCAMFRPTPIDPADASARLHGRTEAVEIARRERTVKTGAIVMGAALGLAVGGALVLVGGADTGQAIVGGVIAVAAGATAGAALGGYIADRNADFARRESEATERYQAAEREVRELIRRAEAAEALTTLLKQKLRDLAVDERRLVVEQARADLSAMRDGAARGRRSAQGLEADRFAQRADEAARAAARLDAAAVELADALARVPTG